MVGITTGFRRASWVVLATLVAASAQAASPVAIGFDGLIANNDDVFTNTFEHGAATSILGDYRTFSLRESDEGGGGGVNTNFLFNTDSPVDNFINDPDVQVDMGPTYFPLLDRSLGGSMFDPDQYELQVEFRPVLPGNVLDNVAPFFNVNIEQYDGFNDDESGVGKRSGEQIGYQIGGADAGMDINSWWAANEQANGFATWTMPMNESSFSDKTYMFQFGDGAYRDDHVVDGADGPDFDSFAGDAIATPNGAVQIHVASAFGEEFQGDLLNVEIKSVRVVPTDPTPGLIARMDGESGVSYRFGSGFTRNPDTDIEIGGTLYSPVSTDQISRFDENGLTNIVINTDDDTENSSFGIYGVADYQTFDGNDARVDFRARLTEELGDPEQGETLTLVLKDLDGNDTAPGEGAEEWTYNLDLNQFNTGDFETASIPLSDFSRTATADQFENEGDGLLTDFNLYQMGGFINSGSGLIDLEIEFMEVRLDVPALEGDYNCDGIVNAADYTVWRDRLGQQFQLDNEGAGVTEGEVTIEDYQVWKSNFGMALGAASGALAAAAVPEPAGVLLLLAGVATLALGSRQKG